MKHLADANINVIFKDEVLEVSKNKIVTKSSKVYLIDKAIFVPVLKGTSNRITLA